MVFSANNIQENNNLTTHPSFFPFLKFISFRSSLLGVIENLLIYSKSEPIWKWKVMKSVFII